MSGANINDGMACFVLSIDITFYSIDLSNVMLFNHLKDIK